jgi:hypothetical protein
MTRALKGDADLLYPAWKHEAYLIARQQFLEPGRYPPIHSHDQMQQRLGIPAVAPIESTGGKTSLDELVDFCSSEIIPAYHCRESSIFR